MTSEIRATMKLLNGQKRVVNDKLEFGMLNTVEAG